MREVLKEDEIQKVVSKIGFESGKTLFALSQEAGLSVNVAYNWSKGIAVPRLPQFLWFLDVAGYRLVLEKKEE